MTTDMEKVIKITAVGATRISAEELEFFQDDLKILTKDKYEKLRANILKYGFSFAVHVWRHEGHNYIIDGHQRVFTVRQLNQIEGYLLPPLPVVFVEAESFKEAKERVLAGASQYGEVQRDGLYRYMSENQIPFDDIVSQFDFPDVDFEKFSAEFFDTPGATVPTDSGIPSSIQSSSDQVKQVQLFFGSEAHQEFITKIESLTAVFGTENITDTVLECVRESHKARNPTP